MTRLTAQGLWSDLYQIANMPSHAYSPAGQQEYHELTAGQRVQIAVLLCSLATSAAITRNQLTDAEDSKKEMRKEQLALKTKLKRSVHSCLLAGAAGLA